MKWKLINFWRARFGGWFRFRVDTYGVIVEKRGLFQPVEVRFKQGFRIVATRVDGPVRVICEGNNVVENCVFDGVSGFTFEA